MTLSARDLEAVSLLRQTLARPAKFWFWRENRASRLRYMTELGVRWCIWCGRLLDEDLNLDAQFCDTTCRAEACKSRLTTGIHMEAREKRMGWKKKRVGDRRSRRFEDFDQWLADFENQRADAFTRAHGRSIRDAHLTCRHWGEPPKGSEIEEDEA